MNYSKIIKICFLVAVFCFMVWKIYIFLLQNSCLDFGNVWDYDNNQCRNDCLTWNHINGCIKMTNSEVKLFEDCRYKPINCIPDSIFNEICLRNNLALNKSTKECDMEFTPDKCNKLKGDWIYPEICRQ